MATEVIDLHMVHMHLNIYIYILYYTYTLSNWLESRTMVIATKDVLACWCPPFDIKLAPWWFPERGVPGWEGSENRAMRLSDAGRTRSRQIGVEYPQSTCQLIVILFLESRSQISKIKQQFTGGSPTKA